MPVLVATLAVPAAADECSDYRIAYVLHETALRVLREATREILREDPTRGAGPEYYEAEERAERDLHKAAGAVRLSLDDEAAAGAIDAIDAARFRTGVALKRWVRYRSDESRAAGWIESPGARSAWPELREAERALNAARHQALLHVCREDAS